MKILLIAPYKKLAIIADNLAKKLDLNITVKQGNLFRGVEIAKKEITKNNADIIISRGGTASLIRNSVNIPVIDIKVTGYDLLRTIYPLSKTKKRIAVIGYNSIIKGCSTICEIIDQSCGFYPIQNQKELDEKFQQAIKSGADAIIGDVITSMIGQKLGLKVELIQSGEEAIHNALNEASTLFENLNEKIKKEKRLNAILENTHEGIIFINKNKSIEVVNSVSLELLHMGQEKISMNTLNKIGLDKKFINNTSISNNTKIIRLADSNIFVQNIQIKSENDGFGNVLILQDTTKIEKLEKIIRKELSAKGLVARYTFKDIITSDNKFKTIIKNAKQYSRADCNILLTGETGTGKELFAQSIHSNSCRDDGPFVPINCAALPDSLLESELFGYTDGAFTGARKGGKKGLFELAHGGTIFLDEITEVSMAIQAKFLRVLQENEIMRIGDNKMIPIDVRIIAATNKNLLREVHEGNFRQDLYYRINILDIKIPSIRQRKTDIIPLFQHFLRQYKNRYQINNSHPDIETLLLMTEYSWPGNVRELENFTEKFIINNIEKPNPNQILINMIEELSHNLQIITKTRKKQSLKDIEIEHILSILSEENNNQSRTAKRLGIDRSTLRRKLNS